MFRRLAARAFLVPQHRFARVQRVCVSNFWNRPRLGCQATPLSTMSDEAAKAEEVEGASICSALALCLLSLLPLPTCAVNVQLQRSPMR